MKRSIALLLIFTCLSLSGCMYSHEITDMAFAVALGFDKAEDGLLVSMQFARPLSISGSGGEGGGGGGESSAGDDKDAAKNKNTTILSVKAEDFYTALSIAENSLSKQINLSHAKLVVFSSELAQDGIGDYVTMLMKNSQFSPNTYTAISLCKAKDYLGEANPSLEVNPAKYYTLLFSRNDSNFMPSTSLRDLYFDLYSPGKEPVLPAANLSKGGAKESSDGSPGEDFVAGEAKKESENKTDVSGLSAIKDGKLCGVLSANEAAAYHMLTGELKNTYISIKSVTRENEFITIRLTQDAPPKICVTEPEDVPQISAKIRLSGELLKCPDEDIKKLGTDGLNDMAARAVTARLSGFFNLTREQLGADIVGFGKKAKMKFADYPSWKEYDWQKHYQKAEFSPEVSVNISREGLLHSGG